MTRGSIREYAEAVRGRYLRASKKEVVRRHGDTTMTTESEAHKFLTRCDRINNNDSQTSITPTITSWEGTKSSTRIF